MDDIGPSNKATNTNNSDTMEGEKAIDSATTQANENSLDLGDDRVTNDSRRTAYVMEWVNGVCDSQYSQSMLVKVTSAFPNRDHLSHKSMQDIKTENENKNVGNGVDSENRTDENSIFDVESAPNRSEPMEYNGKDVYVSNSDSDEGKIR